MAGRRDLNFERLDQILPEVDRLLAGHTPTGSWTLGQVLYHLATALRLSILGSDPPAPDQDPRAERIAAVARKRFFRAGRFPDGMDPPVPALIPPPDADERIEAESLRSALREFGEHDGLFSPHPILGPLTKDEWVEFHKLHAAHHLAFLRPTLDG